MIVKRVLMRPHDGMFKKIWRRNGYRAQWYYFAEGYAMGMGKTARAAIYDARRR